jgi:hypothetical protein
MATDSSDTVLLNPDRNGSEGPLAESIFSTLLVKRARAQPRE